MKVKDNKTSQITTAVYAANRQGNMRMWVNGRFYSDKEFNKRFTIINEGEGNQ